MSRPFRLSVELADQQQEQADQAHRRQQSQCPEQGRLGAPAGERGVLGHDDIDRERIVPYEIH